MCQCSFKTGYCNYIAAGRGIGMKFAFLFSFLAGLAVAILSGFILRMQLNTNDVDSFIDTLPVVKIQDGRIVDPVLDNVVWTIPGEVPEDDIYVVANTTVDNVDAIPPQVRTACMLMIYRKWKIRSLRMILFANPLRLFWQLSACCSAFSL